MGALRDSGDDMVIKRNAMNAKNAKNAMNAKNAKNAMNAMNASEASLARSSKIAPRPAAARNDMGLT
jgi:hypothetical protein